MNTKDITTATDTLNEVMSLVKAQAVLFLRLGKALKKVRDEKLFLHMGQGGYDTFIQFINNPEIGLTQSTAYLYIRIYEYYELKLGLPEGELVKTPLNRLMLLLPKLKKMEDGEAKELIESTNYLTNYDFKEELKERKLHDSKPTMYQCEVCSKWIIEYTDEQICKCDDSFHLINKGHIV